MEQAERSGGDREITLRFVAEPTDENIYGMVHGGAVMKWIDQAGYACAAGWSGRACVTVYVGGIRFYKPIPIGHLVEVQARLIHTGRTSMHVAVDVCSKNLRSGERRSTTHCVIVFVALDGEGQPVPVPGWEPRTEKEKALQGYAMRLMDLSKELEREMRPHVPMGCSLAFSPGWEVDATGGTAGLCQPVERDIYDCYVTCFWPAQVPDHVNNSPDWANQCATATKDWRKLDLVFP